MKRIFTDRMATPFISINTRRCTACWKCTETCPQQVIGKINFFFHKHVVIQKPVACTGCMKCLKACESKAIIQINNVQKKAKGWHVTAR